MDEADIVLVASGDCCAFERIVERNSAFLRNRIYRCGLRVYDVDDVIQEAFVRVLTKAGMFAGGNFRSWLVRIAMNIVRDSFRSRNKFGPITPIDGSFDFESGDQDPAVAAEVSEIVSMVSSAVDSLPDFKSEVLLQHCNGVLLSDIAKAEGVCVSTVKSRLRMAKESVRESLGTLRSIDTKVGA